MPTRNGPKYVISKPDIFAQGLAQALCMEYAPLATYKTFPSGNESKQVFSAYDALKGESVLFVNRGEAPFNSDKVFTETLLATGKLNDEYHCDVWTLLPGFPYAREDKGAERGVVVSRRGAIRDMERYCSHLFAVAEHGSREEDFVGEKFFNFSAVRPVAEHAKALHLRDPLVLAPDGSSNAAVLEIAGTLGADSDSFYKRRDSKTGEIVVNGELENLGGRDLLIYDDMIGMGGTLLKGIKRGRKAGAGRIVAIVALDMSGRLDDGRLSYERIRDMGAEIYATDAVKSEIGTIPMVPHIAEVLKSRFILQ